MIRDGVRRALRHFGLDLVRVSKRGADPAPAPKYTRYLAYEADELFQRTWRDGLALTGDFPRFEAPSKRQERLYDLVQLLLSVAHLPGDLAECGCHLGLSAYFICVYYRTVHPSFHGAGFHIVDSFAGLSQPSVEDRVTNADVPEDPTRFGKLAGSLAASASEVRRALREFPGVELHPGWIPEILPSLPPCRYKLVNIDLDLHAPIRAALEYFLPRMVPGGLMICDDYGSLYWPGAKLAVEEFCRDTGVRYLALSTGQAVVVAGPART